MTRRRVESVAPVGLTLRLPRGTAQPAAPLGAWDAPRIARTEISADRIAVQRSPDLGLRLRMQRPAPAGGGWPWRWLIIEAIWEVSNDEGGAGWATHRLRVAGLPVADAGRIVYPGAGLSVPYVGAAAGAYTYTAAPWLYSAGSRRTCYVIVPAAALAAEPTTITVSAYRSVCDGYWVAGDTTPSILDVVGDRLRLDSRLPIAAWAWTAIDRPVIYDSFPPGWDLWAQPQLIPDYVSRWPAWELIPQLYSVDYPPPGSALLGYAVDASLDAWRLPFREWLAAEVAGTQPPGYALAQSHTLPGVPMLSIRLAP